MPKLLTVLRQIRLLPFSVALKKISKKISPGGKINSALNRYAHTSYIESHNDISIWDTIKPPNLDRISEREKENLIILFDLYLEHKFFLLGAGSDAIYSFDHLPQGFLDYPIHKIKDQKVGEIHQLKSFGLRSQINSRYKNVPWNTDIISGYTWDINTPGLKIKPILGKGIDIKNVWELGRFQFALKLVLASLSIKEYFPDRYNAGVREFEDLVLDFRASCPPGYGAQWIIGMDAGIRIVNVLLAFTWARNNGYDFKDSFARCIVEMTLEHEEFVWNNIEYSDGLPNNHYLSNLCSLLIMYSFLSDLSREQEIRFASVFFWLNRELEKQFNSDGSNFEGSTSYHLFTNEMVSIAFLALKNLPDERKVRANQAMRSLVRDDNDFSKFKKLDFQSVLNAIESKLDIIHDFTFFLSKGGQIPVFGDEDSGSYLGLNIINLNDKYTFNSKRTENQYHSIFERKSIYKSILSRNGIEVAKKYSHFYDDFGIYLLEQYQALVYIKNSGLGLHGRGGHNHNDNLSFCLFLNGIEIVTDPGTFTYSGDIQHRNWFRSSSYHNTLQLINEKGKQLEINPFGEEPEELMWFWKDASKHKTESSTANSYIGSINIGKYRFKRAFILSENKLLIKDECEYSSDKQVFLHLPPYVKIDINKSAEESGELSKVVLTAESKTIATVFSDSDIEIDTYLFSPKYNVKEKAERLILRFDGSELNWGITWS
ncbi:MAG: hypothetical protein Kapaf2KO_17120 [Candidatus Kapaibacteriales bacterium]